MWWPKFKCEVWLAQKIKCDLWLGTPHHPPLLKEFCRHLWRQALDTDAKLIIWDYRAQKGLQNKKEWRKLFFPRRGTHYFKGKTINDLSRVLGNLRIENYEGNSPDSRECLKHWTLDLCFGLGNPGLGLHLGSKTLWFLPTSSAPTLHSYDSFPLHQRPPYTLIILPTSTAPTLHSYNCPHFTSAPSPTLL